MQVRITTCHKGIAALSCSRLKVMEIVQPCEVQRRAERMQVPYSSRVIRLISWASRSASQYGISIHLLSEYSAVASS